MSFEQSLLDYAPQIRLFFFISILASMMLVELKFPRRPLLLPRKQRWPHNIVLVVLNTLTLKLVFPIAALSFATSLEGNHLGLLSFVNIPYFAKVLTAILLLDLLIYCQHVVFHRLPILWRLHSVHHADKDYDVTTGSRFHTIEILLSMALKMAFIWILGAPPIAVLVFEIVLNGMAMVNHSNIKLPKHLDSAVRTVLVTPDMHRVHHSSIVAEMNSNYGFNLSLWDRLFKTYIAQPKLGHEDMKIGLGESHSIAQTNTIKGMLVFPFRKT